MGEFDRGFLAILFIALIIAVIVLAKKGDNHEG